MQSSFEDISPKYNTKSNRIVLLMLLLAGFTCSCNPWNKAEYHSSSLGDEINKKFYDHVKSCRLFVNSMDELASDRDYVPVYLWTKIGDKAQDETASLITTASSRLLFLSVFSEDEAKPNVALKPDFISSRLTRTLREDAMSPIGDVNGGQVLPLRAAGATLYRESCSSYLKSAAEGGVDLGAARMKTALKTEFSSHDNVLLMYGTFESPLHTILTSSGTARRYAKLLFWTNYYSDRELKSKQPMYLRSFRGIIYARTGVEARDSKFDVSAGANGTVNFFTGNINIKAGFGGDSNIDSASFSLYLLGASPHTAQFEPGPTLQDISREFESAFDIASGTIPAIAPGVDHVQEYNITGIPGSLCTDSKWRIDVPDKPVQNVYLGKPTLQVKPAKAEQVGSEGVDKLEIPVCTFVIRGQPSSQLFPDPRLIASQDTTVNIEYTITSVDEVDKYHLSAKVSKPVSVLAGPFQIPLADPVRVKTEEVNGQTRPSWTFRATINDKNGSLADMNKTRPIVAFVEPKIKCEDSNDNTGVRVTKVTPVSGTNEVEVDVVSEGDYKPAQKLSKLTSRSCDFSLKIKVGLIQRETLGGARRSATSEIIPDYQIPIDAKLILPFTNAKNLNDNEVKAATEVVK